jgi:hypothetical protein
MEKISEEYDIKNGPFFTLSGWGERSALKICAMCGKRSEKMSEICAEIYYFLNIL